MNKFKQIAFLLFSFIVFSCFLSEVSAATYYVRADGTVTAANKANATSPSSAGTSLSMAEFNAATFSAGDSILFSSQGGAYTTALTVPSSGSGVGSEITYGNVTAETPTINLSANGLIKTNSKSNIIIRGFSVNYSGAGGWLSGIIVTAGSNITLSNLTVDMGGTGYQGISSGANISNILIDNVTVTNCAANYYNVYFYGASNSNITIQNSSGSTGYYTINNTSTLVIKNISATKGTNNSAINNPATAATI